MLRHIRLGSTEVLRGIYAAVRDANWGTPPARISNLKIDRQPAGFHIRYDAEHRERDIHFQWKGEITGDERGSITFTMDGRALTTFRKNRIGLCVLHPVRECAGRPCTIEKVNGAREPSAFPLYIAPHQPFLDLAAISHEVSPGLTAEVRFFGDVFETEDQRNWTDASFKTYSTPLRLPFPVEIRAGTEMKQSVRLALHGPVPPHRARPAGSAVGFSFDQRDSRPLPALGIGWSGGSPGRIRALGLSHLRVDSLDAIDEAAALGIPLEVTLFVSKTPEAELSRLAKWSPRVARWLVFPATAAPPAHKLLGGAIVSGTNAYFTELNRERPDTASLDGVCFSINPQVHAFDNDTLVENLAAQASVVESARQFAGKLPIVVSPVTLKPRFNPAVTGPEPPPRPGELPRRADVRQKSLFGAGWTAGSLKYLAEGGAASVTYYETAGWPGVMDANGGVYPMYHVLADAGEFRGGEVLSSVSDDPLAVDGLALRKAGRTRLLIASFRPDPQTVRLATAGLGRAVWLKVLDETNAERAMSAPEAYRTEAGMPLEVTGQWIEFTLRPYAVARVDTRKEP